MLVNDNMTENRNTYSIAGVDEEREQLAFASVMRPLLQATEFKSKRVRNIAGIGSGHFATVLLIDNATAIALTTDGVGTKILIARSVGRYETVGIDCIANNVNDLVCIGAEPIALLDYIAIDVADEDVLKVLASGLAEGARQAEISIPGGEIAQVGAMLASTSDSPGSPMFDLVGTAVGLLPQDSPEPLDGSAVVPGDIIIGLRSSGLHSNGYSLARHVLFESAKFPLTLEVPGTGRNLGDELLEPTRIYVKAIKHLWENGLSPHGLVNISGGGLLNLLRLPAKVGYRIDSLPEPQPIFKLIQDAGKIPTHEMYATFNMGVGACAVVSPDLVDDIISSLRADGEDPIVLGETTDASNSTIDIEPLNLQGSGDVFRPRDEI